MWALIGSWAGSRPARPLLIWALSMLVYLVFPLPSWWLFFLIVGLGVALTVTIARVRDVVDDEEDLAEIPAWPPAAPYYQDGLPYQPAGQPWPVYEQATTPPIAYDPGTLLSAVVAVLAAEGLPTNAALGLPAVAQLLADLAIVLQPGVPAPTATGLTGGFALA